MVINIHHGVMARTSPRAGPSVSLVSLAVHISMTLTADASVTLCHK